jgi:hypothetical protein
MTKRILLALLFAPMVAACGSNQPTTSTAANSSQNPAAAAYAYARCMRSHGVTNFPDPKVSVSPGHAAVGFAVSPSETGSPHFKSADKACSGILPAPVSPAQQRAQEQAHKQALLAFATCMRTNGVHGFPDPNAQGRLTLQTVTAAGVDIHARQFLVGAKACVGVTHGIVTLPQIEAAVNGQQG